MFRAKIRKTRLFDDGLGRICYHHFGLDTIFVFRIDATLHRTLQHSCLERNKLSALGYVDVLMNVV